MYDRQVPLCAPPARIHPPDNGGPGDYRAVGSPGTSFRPEHNRHCRAGTEEGVGGFTTGSGSPRCPTGDYSLGNKRGPVKARLGP